jgi:hypothetical protein
MSMKAIVSVAQAQAQLPRLLRSKETVAVQRHEVTVAYIVPRERMHALLETLQVLANSTAMQAIRRDQRGKSRYLPLSALDEDQG